MQLRSHRSTTAKEPGAPRRVQRVRPGPTVRKGRVGRNIRRIERRVTRAERTAAETLAGIGTAGAIGSQILRHPEEAYETIVQPVLDKFILGIKDSQVVKEWGRIEEEFANIKNSQAIEEFYEVAGVTRNEVADIGENVIEFSEPVTEVAGSSLQQLARLAPEATDVIVESAELAGSAMEDWTALDALAVGGELILL